MACQNRAGLPCRESGTRGVGMLLLLTGLMIGCENETVNSSYIPIPESIVLHELSSEVTAVATIEELQIEIPLEVGDTQAAGSFGAIPAGTYTVTIKFISSPTGLILAEAEQQVVFEGVSLNVSFSESDYNYPDDDNDRYSNLNEIITENNPVDASDYPVPRRVFITSIEGQGNLSQWEGSDSATGIEAGDSICQTLADQAGLDDEFRAWLSNDTDDAYCRVAGLNGKKGDHSCDVSDLHLGPYIRTDTTLVAKSLDALLDQGEMYNAIQFDEFANDLRGSWLPVWTGTDATGRYKNIIGSCNNWTSVDSGDNTTYGSAHKTIVDWVDHWHAPCGSDSSARLYCFQVSAGDTVPPIYKTENAMTVFLSSSKGTGDLSSWPGSDGNSGALAGNSICQNLAYTAGFSNADKYVAWLSSDAEDAIDQLQWQGPWVRPDGVLIAENLNDLTDGSLSSSITQTEKGDYLSGLVWTGTGMAGRGYDNANSPLPSCENWGNASTTVKGRYGESNDTIYKWTDSGDLPNGCDMESHLYCIESE